MEYIMKVLNSCDFDTTIGVQVLVEKSLITKERETIQMHDLIQLIGMDIVKQECRNDPGRRSRLWLCEDVRDVLSGEMGTNAVKAIVLVLPKTKAIDIGPDAFTNMRRLRLVIMINVHNSFQGPISLPNELRWFEWPECPWFPEFSSCPNKLVGLDLHKTNIQVVREQFKDFGKLKYLNFSECPSVVCIPDLNLTPNLKELDLHGCKHLERAHESVPYHTKLRLLNLKGCSNLHQLPNVLQSKNLEILNLTGCSKLQRFPDIPDKIEGLEELYLKGTSIEELPTSIENLVSLENLSLINCKKLANLPSTIYKLPNLESLILHGCSKLIKFPKEGDFSVLHGKTGFPKLQFLGLEGCNLLEVEFLENNSCFPYLTELYLSKQNFAKLPTCRRLHNLRALVVSECRQLQEIEKLWGVDPFGPNDSSSFQFGVRESGGAIVKKCGFRLLCKPLEDDLETLYQDDQLLDPALLYEIWHDNKETTTEEESSAHLSLRRWLGHEDNSITRSEEDRESEIEEYDANWDVSEPADIMADFSVEKYRYSGTRTSYKNIIPRGDMREEFVSIEGGTISFMVSQDFYDKFLGLYLKPNVLWGMLEGAVDFLEFDEDYLRFSLTLIVSGGTMEKLGYVLRCKQLDDELKAVLEDNQLVDPASLCELEYRVLTQVSPAVKWRNWRHMKDQSGRGKWSSIGSQLLRKLSLRSQRDKLGTGHLSC
ncbi:disease resistance protein RPP2B [Eucalyptus grandis]|uniref:disease resistance protein RPP2B n=1 Tax=Eucalyptus grandis TaxID=71139 RepID=UPI00192EBBEF|nr:disease resistance protein RPP2B [Eucalyptus grandis]